MKTASLIQAQEKKLERQRATIADTEHMIRVLRRQLAEETMPTPIELAAAEAAVAAKATKK